MFGKKANNVWQSARRPLRPHIAVVRLVTQVKGLVFNYLTGITSGEKNWDVSTISQPLKKNYIFHQFCFKFSVSQLFLEARAKQ